MPSIALRERGVAYVELRSLDVNAFDPHGINSEQLYFLEVFMLFCLLQESPALTDSEIYAIDENLLLVAHRGRQPGLDIGRGDEKISLQDWASELCRSMIPVANLLDNANYCENYFSSVKAQIAAVYDPDLTPSARMLADMRAHGEGFYHHAKRMSQHHYQYYKNTNLSDQKVSFFNNMTKDSLQHQLQMENEDELSFDRFLEDYFSQNTQ